MEDFVTWDLLGRGAATWSELSSHWDWQVKGDGILASESDTYLMAPWYSDDFELKIAWEEPKDSGGFDLGLVRRHPQNPGVGVVDFRIRFSEGQPLALKQASLSGFFSGWFGASRLDRTRAVDAGVRVGL